MLFAGLGNAQTGAPSTAVRSSAVGSAAQAASALYDSTLKGTVEYWTSLHYSVIRPNKVEKVSGSTLFFPKFPGRAQNPKIDLKGKTITVKTQAGQVVSFADVKADSSVMICERDNAVVIIIMNSTSSVFQETTHAQ